MKAQQFLHKYDATIPLLRKPNSLKWKVLFVILLSGASCAAVEDCEQPHFLPTSDKDKDGDGIPDEIEQRLAEQFAPIVFHPDIEQCLPTNVDELLKHTTLRIHDDTVTPNVDEQVAGAVDQTTLISKCYIQPPPLEKLRSGGTRSTKKHRTFYLADVPDVFHRGSVDTKDWTTYFHCYPNTIGGVTIQYWRFYAYNNGLKSDVPFSIGGGFLSYKGKVPIEVGNHGGDWEGMQVVLNKDNLPTTLVLLGHKDLSSVDWTTINGNAFEGGHLKIQAELGGHESQIMQGSPPTNWVRQETWTGGRTRFGQNPDTVGGLLLNIGERGCPLNGQVFVQYSGLWGSPSRSPEIIVSEVAKQIQDVPPVLASLLQKAVSDAIFGAVPDLYYINSGYWGPAFNETGSENRAGRTFMKAWAGDYSGKEPSLSNREQFPDSESP